MIRTFQRVSIALALILTTACASSRYYDARYLPAPLEVRVAAQSVEGSQVRVLATVLGIARKDEKAGRPEQVEVRVRFENLGAVEALILEDGFSLLSADLTPFAAVALAPDADLRVPAGETRTLDIAFGSSARELDWSGLNLRLAVSFQDVRVTAAGTFTRVVYAPVEPVRWSFGLGYGYGYCW
ncbi:MAG: hypothetical protein JNL28_00480 [Planctomycetes bacterium]|nr:hypothetical protein [Planctomycetota bacterium]